MEQINALQVELTWLSSFASASLRSDIEREQNRFPFKDLVGMTLDEALDYADLNWPQASAGQPPTPTRVPFPTETLQPLPTCLVGTSAGCSAPPSLVSNSDGKWAYHVLKNVYFEYPSDWDVKQDFDYYQTVTFVPPADSPVGLNTTVIKFIFTYANLPDDVDYDLIACDSPGTVSQRPPLLFHREITDSDFRGSEILWDLSSRSTTLLVLQASTYSESQQLILCLFTIAQGDQTKKDLLITNPQLVEREFSNFHHILESIRIWDKNSFILPTATVTETLPPSPVPTPSPVAFNSDSPWVSKIINGVYFEYPGNWAIKEEIAPEMTLVTLVPPSNSFESLSTRGMFFGVRHFAFSSGINYDEIGCTSDGTFQMPNVLLRQQIDLADFKGNKAVWKDEGSPPTMYIESVIYNKEHQTMVCWIAVIDNDLTGNLLSHPENVDENYPTIQQILESIKIWDE